MNKVLSALSIMFLFSCISGTGKIVPVVDAPEKSSAENSEDIVEIEVPSLPVDSVAEEKPVPEIFEWEAGSPVDGNIDVAVTEIPVPEIKLEISRTQTANSVILPPPAVPEKSEKENLSKTQPSEEPEVSVNGVGTGKAEGRAGESISVKMAGSGWLFLGQGESNSREISFLSRVTLQDETVFYFKAENEGSYVLKFQKQDPLSGSIVLKNVILKVEKAEEAISEKSDGITNPSFVNNDSDSGKKQDALSEIKELLEKGIDERDMEKLSSFQTRIRNSEKEYLFLFTGESYPSRIETAGKILIKGGRPVQGVYLLERLKRKSDEVLYILGYSYQNYPAIRDERKAALYYRELIKEYPASIYWDNAKKEYLFIKRMYIDVR